MSTHSTISVVTPETIYQIYCNSDGYTSYNGKMLIDHYNSLEKALELVSLGDLSYLKKKVHPTPGARHNYDTPEPGVNVYYGRDRGEKRVDVKKYKDIKEFATLAIPESFNYIFNNGKWYLITGWSKCDGIGMVEVEELLLGDESWTEQK